MDIDCTETWNVDHVVHRKCTKWHASWWRDLYAASLSSYINTQHLWQCHCTRTTTKTSNNEWWSSHTPLTSFSPNCYLLKLFFIVLYPYLAPSIPCMTWLSPSSKYSGHSLAKIESPDIPLRLGLLKWFKCHEGEVKDGYCTIGIAAHATVLLNHGNMNSTRSSLV